ncbi:hypothetical protein SAMN05216404_11289 [Nitrosospira multiformis]|uniref:Uncharacterized protein n=1 Tax=Nitrosospira multiformis TaxID=1231 RepID=A0A1H8MCV4_9PROT|nr:hypothetical protein SAMN05216404_11289 [Nitrosospira multiformis]
MGVYKPYIFIFASTSKAVMSSISFRARDIPPHNAAFTIPFRGGTLQCAYHPILGDWVCILMVIRHVW